MNMHDCICGAPALYIKIELRKVVRGPTTFIIAPKHIVKCSQQCGKSMRRDTARETKKAWNERMKALKAAEASNPAVMVATDEEQKEFRP